VPDGSRDLTAHVALDACAAAAAATAGATGTLLTTQRAALRALGVHGTRPPRELASADPPAYLAALARAGQAAELTDPGGLGGFGWLVQSVGVPLPLQVGQIG
jgi:SAM-dependent MidA family methyltransferase